jgi:hypothetical protein
MRNTLWAIVGVMMITAMSALAAFKPPIEKQLKEAASNPASMAALLEGASSEQAAQVIKAVVIEIASMGLDLATQDTRINRVIMAAFSAAPAGSAPMLASSLGTACGASLAVSRNAAVVSSIQTAIVKAGGSSGAVMAQTFATAYTKAKASSEAGHNDVLDNAPPLAKGYDGQK